VSDTVTPKGPVRILLLVAGTLSVALAVLGIFLPLLPTTPLLLLAAWCYARSSERFYRRLLANRWLGPYIRNYREGRGMTEKAKASSIGLLWVVMLMTIGIVTPVWWMGMILIGIATGISIFLLRLPTYREDVADDQMER